MITPEAKLLPFPEFVYRLVLCESERRVVQLRGMGMMGGKPERCFPRCTNTWKHPENETRIEFLTRN